MPCQDHFNIIPQVPQQPFLFTGLTGNMLQLVNVLFLFEKAKICFTFLDLGITPERSVLAFCFYSAYSSWPPSEMIFLFSFLFFSEACLSSISFFFRSPQA